MAGATVLAVRRRLLAGLAGLPLLSACAGLGTRPVPSGELPARANLGGFMLEGRFSLRHEEQSYSGRLSWRHAPPADELLLTSPLGQGIAEIRSGADGVRLQTSDGRLYAAADVETLTHEVLGYPLPLVRLADWVRARVGNGEVENDAAGRPLRLRADGWRIEYGYDSDDPAALPGRLFAERAGVLELRLRIEEWHALDGVAGGVAGAAQSPAGEGP